MAMLTMTVHHRVSSNHIPKHMGLDDVVSFFTGGVCMPAGAGRQRIGPDTLS